MISKQLRTRMSDSAFIELLDAVAKPDSGWHKLDELEKRRRIDLLDYDQRQAFRSRFEPMVGLIAQLASFTYSLETKDSAALQAQYAEITKPVTR